MSFNLESGKSKEINETPEVKVDSEQLSETEETAENFDDCSLNEVQDSKGNEVNAESLEDAEENYDDCAAKIEEMEEKNPELAEEDDFSDCGKETDDQYVAEVTYTTDGELSQEEANAELQKAYNECDDPEDMQQLKENANENKHIEVHNAEVVERPENGEIGEEITEEEYKEAQKELDEAQENLEAQQETAQEYQEDLESQINKHEDEVSEGTENINNENPESFEETESSNEIEEIAEDTDDSEGEEIGVKDLEDMEDDSKVETSEINEENLSENVSQEVEEKTDTGFRDKTREQIAEEQSKIMDDEIEQKVDEIAEQDDLTEKEAKEQISEEVSEAVNEELFEDDVEVMVEEKYEAIEEKAEEQEAVDAAEETADDLEDEKTGQLPEQSDQSLQERIDGAFEKEDVTVSEISSLSDEHSAELQAKIEEKSTTEAELKTKFDEVLSKEKGSDEYRQSLQEYNALQYKKSELDEQIATMEKQQNLLNEKRLELRETQIQKGVKAVAASNATLAEVSMLQERYDQTYYNTKVDKNELTSIREDSCSAIRELSVEKVFINQAMEAKMGEISEYIISNNIDRYNSAHDFHYQQLSAEYDNMKKCYDKIGYSIVKLDENNKSITERLEDKYISRVDSKEFVSIISALEESNVTYRPIESFDKKRTENEIIKRLSGGDLTEGSCSSLALAYVGNKAGYDVLDFRDGKSRSFFSSRDSIQKVANLPNVNSIVIYGKDDIECANKLFWGMETGKEYYLATGQHASIVRRCEDNLEYLELQHPSTGNGWHNLDNSILLSRFGCSESHSFDFSNFLIDVDSLSNSQEFLSILGYINTSSLEQKKGVIGNVR